MYEYVSTRVIIGKHEEKKLRSKRVFKKYLSRLLIFCE